MAHGHTQEQIDRIKASLKKTLELKRIQHEKDERNRTKPKTFTIRPASTPDPEQIKKLRKKLLVTQETMASFFGLSVSQYRNIEKGRFPPPPIVCRVFLWIRQGWMPPELERIRHKY